MPYLEVNIRKNSEYATYNPKTVKGRWLGNLKILIDARNQDELNAKIGTACHLLEVKHHAIDTITPRVQRSRGENSP